MFLPLCLLLKHNKYMSAQQHAYINGGIHGSLALFLTVCYSSES